MLIEIHFKNHAKHEYVDFVELKKKLQDEVIKTLTLDWDSSEVTPGCVVGRGVYIKDETFDDKLEEEGNEEFAYGNGRISELAGFTFSGIQTYDPDKMITYEDTEVSSISVFDGNHMLCVPIWK